MTISNSTTTDTKGVSAQKLAEDKGRFKVAESLWSVLKKHSIWIIDFCQLPGALAVLEERHAWPQFSVKLEIEQVHTERKHAF